MSKHIYGVHDWSEEWGGWVKQAGVTGWCVTTHQYLEEPPAYFWGMGEFGITPIARLNWSHHGRGTIPPDPADDVLFASWCANFVNEADHHVKHYIIGNEPNIGVEWGSGRPITPQRYVDCYRRVYTAMKNVNPDAILMPAAVGPWNIESGMGWVEYFAEVLRLLDGAYEAINLHTYARGYDPASVVADNRMNPPYQDYRNGFRAYRDFLAAVPFAQRHKPVFITETNGNEPWPEWNTDWVQAAYEEIDFWNGMIGTQKIHALVLFRWPKFDRAWQFETKPGVHVDFCSALQHRYRVPVVAVPGRRMRVVADILNVRSGPGVQYPIVGQLRYGDVVEVLGETDGWGVMSGGYVALQWLHPLEQGRGWERVYSFIRRWEGGWSNHSDDPGGATMYGVTLATYTAWRLQQGRPTPTMDDLRNITEAEVEAIYRTYWTQSGADRMEWPMNLLQIDTAINAGVGTARWLYERSGGDFLRYMGHLLTWYADVRNFHIFGRGWTKRRAAILLEAAQDMRLVARD